MCYFKSVAYYRVQTIYFQNKYSICFVKLDVLEKKMFHKDHFFIFFIKNIILNKIN